MSSIKYDKSEVKQLATGRWKEIFETLGIHFELRKHQPCPKCGGRDRFRPFDDFESTGGMVCGAGGCDRKFADGFEAVQWYTDCEFQEAVDKVGEIVGAQPKKAKKRLPIDRLNLDQQVNELFVPSFLAINDGISQPGLARMQIATGNFDGEAVVAFPCWMNPAASKPSNWVIMGALAHEIWHRENGRDVKVRKKTLAKGWGLMGDVAGMTAADLVWKCEGPTDCAAFLSHLSDVCVTNIHGAGESPDPMIPLFVGKTVNLVHDPDEAGQKGAAKWIEALRRAGCSVRNVRLPDEYDLRKYLIEFGSASLRMLADNAELLGPLEGAQAEASQVPPSDPLADSSYDRRLVPDDCIEILTRLQLEVVCQDDEGQVTVYSRATGLVRTIRNIERLQLANLLTFGGLPCYRQVTEGMDEDVDKISIRDVRKAIGIAASSKQVAGKVELRGHGIYATHGDVVLCNGKYLSIYTQAGQWVKTERPFHRDLVFGFSGEQHNWYDHDGLGELIALAKDPSWCAKWIKQLESIIDRWSFGNAKTDPLLMAGLVLSTFVQQIWHWRPQVSIRGQSNSGKSALFEFLFGGESTVGVFNGMAVKVSLSSAAGIRQKIKLDSVILGVDEFDQLKRPQDILNLMRTAGRGEKLVMGSTSQKHVEYGLTNICWLAGIFVSLDSEADQNRFLEFDLRKPREPKRSNFRQPTVDEIKALQGPLAAIAITHAANAAEVARASYMTAKETEKHLNDRIVESLSIPASILTLAAGGSTPDVCRLIEAFSEPIRRDVEVISNHDDLLLEILRLTIDIGAGSKVSVAQALCDPKYVAHKSQVETQVGVTRRDDDRGAEWLIVHPASVLKKLKAAEKDHLMSIGSIRQVLLRIDGAIKYRSQISRTQLNCVWIPWSYIAVNVDQENLDEF